MSFPWHLSKNQANQTGLLTKAGVIYQTGTAEYAEVQTPRLCQLHNGLEYKDGKPQWVKQPSAA